jgi:uncharacterized protein
MNSNIRKLVESNNIKLIQELISNGLKFNRKNSPLGLAILLGNTKMVQTLIDGGCHVEWGGDLEPSPLHIATNEGQTEIVKLLVTKNAKLNTKDEIGFTPLMIAAAKGYFDIVKILIEAGAKTNIESEHGDFALYSAKSNRHHEIYEYLLPLTSVKLIEKINNGIDFSGKNKSINKQDRKFDELINAIAEVNFIKSNFSTQNVDDKMLKIDGILGKINNYQTTDSNRLSALHHAISSPKIVEILLTKGFSKALNIQDCNGNTALSSACIHGLIEVVKSLLDAGAKTELKNEQGDTALLSTVKFSKSNEIIKLLYNAGANLESQDNFGNTSIIIAYTQSKSQHFPEEAKNNVDLLKSLGASVERFKEIDFIENAGKGDKKAIIDFIESGGNINCLGVGGTSALKMSVACNQLEILSVLLDRGADINNTASTFISAVYAGNIGVVQYLIDAGVDVDEPDPSNGIFALTRAVEKNNIAMVNLLLEAGVKVPRKDPVFGDVGKMAKIVNAEIYKLISRFNK